MNKVYLLTGGNMDDREACLTQAAEGIARECGEIVQQSAWYETEAWGLRTQDPFLNQALALLTRLSPSGLLQTLLRIENAMGRKRREKYGPRLIDIDILLFNKEVIETDNLRIPHPELARRRFALVPLAEIAADYVHPLLNKSIARLLLECSDPLSVKKL